MKFIDEATIMEIAYNTKSGMSPYHNLAHQLAKHINKKIEEEDFTESEKNER